MTNLKQPNRNDIELLAGIQHEIWGHWMNHLFSVCQLNHDGSYTIPAEKANRWMNQIITKYQDLSEKEKDSDREQALKILAAIDKNK